MMPAEIIAAVGWINGRYSNTATLAREARRALCAGILRIFPPLLPVTVFYSYYSSQVNCEPAQNVFPYFPIIAALLKKRLSSFSWKPMSTLQAVQLLKQKKKKDANVRVAENITVHSRSGRPSWEGRSFCGRWHAGCRSGGMSSSLWS